MSLFLTYPSSQCCLPSPPLAASPWACLTVPPLPPSLLPGGWGGGGCGGGGGREFSSIFFFPRAGFPRPTVASSFIGTSRWARLKCKRQDEFKRLPLDWNVFHEEIIEPNHILSFAKGFTWRAGILSRGAWAGRRSCFGLSEKGRDRILYFLEIETRTFWMMLHVQSRVCLSSAYFFACDGYWVVFSVISNNSTNSI